MRHPPTTTAIGGLGGYAFGLATCKSGSGGGKSGGSGSGSGGGTENKATSPNQMQKQVERGQAPKTVIRVDQARVPFEKPNVHFADGSALNMDGTWKHGGRELTSAEANWLSGNGWGVPK